MLPTAVSDDGVVLGLKFDISRVKQTLDQVKKTWCRVWLKIPRKPYQNR